jgi:phospholipid transport system substrate-binding protein
MSVPKVFQMKNLFLGLGALLFSALAVLAVDAKADSSKEAAAFVQKLGDRAVGVLATNGVNQEADHTFRNMLHQDFDLSLIAKFALGPTTWRSITPAQRQEYLDLFEKLVVQIYSDRFKLYSGESFKVVTAKPEDERDTYVVSYINKAQAGAPPIEVDWRVRSQGGRSQIIDVIVEGVSMTVTQRSEFAAVIQQQSGDFDAFLKILRDRIANIT